MSMLLCGDWFGSKTWDTKMCTCIRCMKNKLCQTTVKKTKKTQLVSHRLTGQLIHHVFPFPGLSSLMSCWLAAFPQCLVCVCVWALSQTWVRVQVAGWEKNWPSEEGCRSPWNPAGQPSACGWRQTNPSAQSPWDREFGKVGLFVSD